jgi:endoglucanase
LIRKRLIATIAAVTATVIAAAASPAYAADTTPPTTPGEPVASDITEVGATLTWPPSTDDVAVANYEVWHIHTDIVQRLGTPTAPTFTITTLRRGTVNRFWVNAVDTSGNRSGSSPLITVTTLPGDLEPPGPVIFVTASELTDTSVRLTWQGVIWGDVDQYRIYQGTGTVGPLTLIGTQPFNVPRTFVVTGLSPATQYRFGVSARDAVGNENGPSIIAVTTTGAPTPTCSVSYRVPSQWTPGFVAQVRITNTGTDPVTGWSLAWQFPNDQQITQLWNGDYRQEGASVTVTNLPYNATMPPGGGWQEFGFLGTWSGGNGSPDAFTLNGRTCLVS